MITIVLFKDSNATRGRVSSDLILIDNHVDPWYTRRVHVVGLIHLMGQLWEELKELCLARFDLQLMFVVELDQILFERVQRRR